MNQDCPKAHLANGRFKIALIGSHGVGKTTLCYDLAARLKRRDLEVELVAEIARRCPLPINTETTRDAQAWILHRQIAAEIEASICPGVVLCDRSVLDNYCYLKHAGGASKVWEALIREHLPSYDLLVRVPIYEAPRWDGTRAVDPGFQRQIDRLLELEIAAFGLDVFTLDAAQRDLWPVLIIDALIELVDPNPPLFTEAELGG